MAKEISNLITFNTYKFERGGLLVDMFNQFNARVGDQGTELAIQWETSKTETKINLKERGLHFFGTGSVGQYLEKLEDGTGFKMSADASTVEWEDKDEAGSLDDGITVVKLPKQFFPQKGIFFGYFGLKDKQGNVFTSVNVWFRVLGGVPTMGAAIPYFVTEFDEVLERCNGKIVDALAELREKYQAEVKKNEDMSAETRAALSKLADAVGAIQAQIDAGNVITRAEYNDLAGRIDNRLATMDLKPESFVNLDAVKAAYPDGSPNLIVTDDGHRAVFRDGQWIDGGIYQAAGIGDNSVGSKQVSTISASKIIDNQLNPLGAEGLGNINVVGNNEYVMIVSNEAQTADKLVGTFIPLSITSDAPLTLTAKIKSSLDTGYNQPLYLADKNKTVLRQVGYVAIPDKSTSVNVKQSFNITEDPGEYYLLITSKAVGVVSYYNLTVNESGTPSSTVAEEIGNLAAARAFDTIINNDVRLDKVSATNGVELTRDGNIVTAKVNKAHSAEETQAIFFPVHVQTRNAEFAGTVKVAPIKFPGTYTQQIYLADAERNIGEQLGTFQVNSQTSANFKISLPASQDFCIALIASVTGTFEFELTVNDSTGRNDVNLAKYTTWLDSGTYDHARMDISRIDYSNMNPKTIDGVEYVAPYHTFGVDNGRLNAIYVWAEKAGTYSFCVGKLDQNNLIVDGKYFDLQLAKGFNSIGMNIRTDSASNLFMKITDGVSLYEGNQAIKVQTSGQHINSGVYSGDYFQDNHGVLPFGYDVTSLSPTDRIRDVEEQQRQNTASIAQLKGATAVLTADNGVKYKLIVGNDGTLSTKNMTPNKVRVFGNSLTATTEGFGLAASDPQHDYYYLMSQYILGKNSRADIQRHGVGEWESGTNSSDRQKAFDDIFKPYLDADTDLVIVQCMENVNSAASQQTLPQDSVTLLQNIKNVSPNAQIIWMYGWWGDRTVFDPAQNACDKVGAKGINLNDIGTQKSMQSYAGQSRTLQDGTVRKIQENEASHPGDAGMKAIADRLIANFDF